ncbi:MAG: hypothetical protein KGQ66_14865 [Acidobacteriota bacterium]|nr:hypothetical protein [Acidobacteriota bacterium]
MALAAIGGVVALAATRTSSTAGYDTNPKAFVLPALSAPGKVSLRRHGRGVTVVSAGGLGVMGVLLVLDRLATVTTVLQQTL